MSFQKIRTLVQNPQGKPVTNTSYVKFKTYSQQKPQNYLTHSGSISHNTFSPQIVSLLLTMKQGEKIQFNTNQQQINEVMVIDLIEVKDGQEFVPNYKKAEGLKNKGNQQIKVKNYQKAAQFYEQGLRLVEYECTPQAEQIKISLLSNLSLAYLNTNRLEQCIGSCEKYLSNSLEPNKKIVYRKGCANKNLKRWQEAMRDIKLGLQICGQDEQGRKDFELLEEMVRKQKKIQSEKEKKVYSKMFG